MSGPRAKDELTGARRTSLEDVLNLEITYSRLRPGPGACFVEYFGGRVEVLEVDRFLIEQLLEQLKHRGFYQLLRTPLTRSSVEYQSDGAKISRVVARLRVATP